MTTGNVCPECGKRAATSMHIDDAGAHRVCAICHERLRQAHGCTCEHCKQYDAILGKDSSPMAKNKKTNGHAVHGPETDVAEGASKPVEIDRYEELLPCRIDEDLVHSKAIELAAVIRTRESVLEEKRAANAEYRDQLAAFDSRLLELAEAVEGKIEKRNVLCVEFLLPNNEVQTVRQDTGEIVGKRTATPEELQQEIPGAGKRNPAPASEEASAP